MTPACRIFSEDSCRYGSLLAYRRWVDSNRIIPLASAGGQSKHWHKGHAGVTSDFNGSEGVVEASWTDLRNRRDCAEAIASSAGIGNRGRSSSTKKSSCGNCVVMVAYASV